jgi:hypothetical protein
MTLDAQSMSMLYFTCVVGLIFCALVFLGFGKEDRREKHYEEESI